MATPIRGVLLPSAARVLTAAVAAWPARVYPTVSAVPAGFTDDGLPRSVQLIVPPNREDLILSLAAQIEAERPWADSHPPVS